MNRPGPAPARAAWLLAAATSVALLGCPTPTQYGGPIPMNPSGIEDRIAWVCGLGQSNPDVSSFCFASEPAPPGQAPTPAATTPAAASAPPASPGTVAPEPATPPVDSTSGGEQPEAIRSTVDEPAYDSTRQDEPPASR